MAFNPQTINKELDMANLAKHNANYSAIKTELDAHDTHVAAQTAHGSTPTATAGKIMQRDSAGRAKVAAPSESDDIARKAEVDAVQTNLDTHKADNVAHLSTSDREKLDGLEVGAEANQNAFAQVNNVVAGAESDTLTIAGGTGITVSTNPTTKTVTVTATGTATPGAHGSSHNNDGADPIPDLVTLRDEFDALTPAEIGAETPAGAQARVDALAGTGNTKTVVEVSTQLDGAVQQLNTKVDKVVGKGLSSNDYTNDDKAKVASVEFKADIAYVNTKVSSVASGSPKKTFSTFAELQAFYPAGNDGIYIVVADGSWYYWDGNSWVAGGVYQSAGVADGSITTEKLAFTAIKGTASKNLFDRSTALIDRYVMYNNGAIEVLAGYCASDWIKILPNTVYTKNDSQQLAFYDSAKNYVSGLDAATTFTTPANASYLRLTVVVGNLETLQLERGPNQTSYETYDAKVSVNSLPPEYKQIYANTIVVAKSGGYYKTINEALESAVDSATTPVTILIMPGIYEESVNLIGRYVSLVGVNKDTCIIKTYTNDYYHPPVDLSANANLSNLTIIADDNGTTTPPGGVGGLPSYAVHHDIAGRGYSYADPKNQGTSRVSNCVLISKHTHAMGIGLSNKQTLILENCEFIAYGSSAFRAHNFIGAGATGQRMIVKNCEMHNDGTTAPIVLQDANHGTGGAGDNVDTVFSFVNNVAWSEMGGQSSAIQSDTPASAGCVAGHIKLGVASFGNSSSAINA
ncbi:hypothetical protein [Paenibacillus illinoisensis]|uniref:hypothetical protein n=1 Tax=Paenibacillus illinoisensis TaxID=59845 RepID=UPI00203F53F0|nr:hypothetical protein [Paenibacillus illinoisensis]MCM3205606.1 hypothetical protein [Paenibacillus illinoisensis]